MQPEDLQSMTGSFSLWVRSHFPQAWGRYWSTRAMSHQLREVLNQRAPAMTMANAVICTLHQLYWFCRPGKLPVRIEVPGSGRDAVMIALPEGVPLFRLEQLNELAIAGIELLAPLVLADRENLVIYMAAGAGAAVIDPMQAVIGNRASLQEELGPQLWAEVEMAFAPACMALGPGLASLPPQTPVGLVRSEAETALMALHRFAQISCVIHEGERMARAA
ncbi:hypothetical protein AB2D15_23180 [Pseudomonas aeruginosa]